MPLSLITIATLLLAFSGRSYCLKNESVAVTWRSGSIAGAAASGNDDACGGAAWPRCRTLETRSFYDGKASSTSYLVLLFEFVSLSCSKFGTGSWRIF